MAKELSEFQKRCKMLKQLGVEFGLDYEYRGEGADRKSHDVDVFKTVSIPFSAHELIGILMNEGQFYIGGCCGNTSAIQDKVDSMLRFGQGWISVKDLEEIAESRIGHDGEDSEFLKLKRPLEKEVAWCARQLVRMKKKREQGKQVLDPWYWMAIVWHITKDHYGPERPRQEAHVVNDKRDALDDAVSTLSRGLYSIAIEDMFSDRHDDSDKPQRDANRLVVLARLLPALKTLNEHIGKLQPPPLEGAALVLKEDPDNVLANGLGLCIYGSNDDAQRLINLWVKEDEQYVGEGAGRRRAATDFVIRNVKVTVDKGVEFL